MRCRRAAEPTAVATHPLHHRAPPGHNLTIQVSYTLLEERATSADTFFLGISGSPTKIGGPDNHSLLLSSTPLSRVTKVLGSGGNFRHVLAVTKPFSTAPWPP